MDHFLFPDVKYFNLKAKNQPCLQATCELYQPFHISWFLIQDHAKFVTLILLLTFDYFLLFFLFVQFNKVGVTKENRKPLQLRERDLMNCEEQSHATSLTGAHTTKVKWNNLSNLFNVAFLICTTNLHTDHL